MFFCVFNKKTDIIMQLTDLNIDCLEGILEHLQMRDLLNAADANKRLRHAASFIFDRKYSRKYLYFGFIYDSNVFERRSVHTFDRANFKILIDNEDLSGSDMRPAFQMLRCFGRFVYRLNYFFHEDCTEDHKIYYDLFDYIEKYCSETLSSFDITFFDHQSKILLFKKPFVKVENLQLSLVSNQNNTDSNVTKEFAASGPLKMTKDCLVMSFPKIKKLHIRILAECSQFIHSGCIANHFSYLEELILRTDVIEKCESCAEIYANLLRSNPQLKSFDSWQTEIDMNIFQSLNESLQSLEHLDIFDFGDFIKNFNGKKLRLKNVKHFWLRGPLPETCVNPFSFDQLESLVIDMDDEPYKPIEYFEDYFEENQSIRTLHLRMPYENIFNSLIQNQVIFTERFPSLKEFKLTVWDNLSIAEALDVKARFNKLAHFQFQVREESEYKNLQKHFSLAEWSYSRFGDRWVLLKRRNRLT